MAEKFLLIPERHAEFFRKLIALLGDDIEHMGDMKLRFVNVFDGQGTNRLIKVLAAVKETSNADEGADPNTGFSIQTITVYDESCNEFTMDVLGTAPVAVV